MANKMKNRAGIEFYYDLDKEHMEKYVRYLEKRYGKKRAYHFSKKIN
jgi:hypothetical protein